MVRYRRQYGYTVLDYTTERIEDLSTYAWEQYAILKLGVGAGAKVVGVRTATEQKVWHRPATFTRGKQCVQNAHRAYKDGLVELLVRYDKY